MIKVLLADDHAIVRSDPGFFASPNIAARRFRFRSLLD